MNAPPPKANLLVIRSPDITRAAKFYSALGLPIGRDAHGSGPEHCVSVVDGFVFEIYPLSPGQTPTTSTRLGFLVDSLDRRISMVVEVGATVLVPPAACEGGRRAVVADVDGHRVELFAPDDSGDTVESGDTMEELEDMGHVSGEGGPLLLADRTVVTAWRGGSEDGRDYDEACASLEASPTGQGVAIPIDRGVGLIWDMQGGGTAVVFRRARDHVVVVRDWLEDDAGDDAHLMLAEEPASELARIAELPIESGVLAILWAPEDGSAFEELDGEGFPMDERMSMGGTGLTLELVPGLYDCFHDRVTNAAGDARRCHLIRRKGDHR